MELELTSESTLLVSLPQFGVTQLDCVGLDEPRQDCAQHILVRLGSSDEARLSRASDTWLAWIVWLCSGTLNWLDMAPLASARLGWAELG